MDLNWIWKAALIFIVGTFILRIGGRKSISQMTISQTRLRQAGIASIEDVKYATIEVSGQLGYELIDSKKPLTQGNMAICLRVNMPMNRIDFWKIVE